MIRPSTNLDSAESVCEKMRQSDLEGFGALRHALPTTYVSPMNMAPNITAIAMAGKNERPWWLPAVKSEPAKTARTSVGKIERSITTKIANASSSQRRRMRGAYPAAGAGRPRAQVRARSLTYSGFLPPAGALRS